MPKYLSAWDHRMILIFLCVTKKKKNNNKGTKEPSPVDKFYWQQSSLDVNETSEPVLFLRSSLFFFLIKKTSAKQSVYIGKKVLAW